MNKKIIQSCSYCRAFKKSKVVYLNHWQYGIIQLGMNKNSKQKAKIILLKYKINKVWYDVYIKNTFLHHFIGSTPFVVGN